MPVGLHGEETTLRQLHSAGAQHLNTLLKHALGFHCCPCGASLLPSKAHEVKMRARDGRERRASSQLVCRRAIEGRNPE
jgi:hypothetical protein